MNKARLLNQAAVKELLLEHAKATRAHKFTRVSSQTLINLNETLRMAIVRHVMQMPSKGKTL